MGQAVFQHGDGGALLLGLGVDTGRLSPQLLGPDVVGLDLCQTFLSGGIYRIQGILARWRSSWAVRRSASSFSAPAHGA